MNKRLVNIIAAYVWVSLMVIREVPHALVAGK